jgi:hypothetical protein
MNYCTHASVAQEIASAAGEDYSALTDLDLTSLRRYIQRRARYAWERDWWAELMRSEERHLRDAWTATSYADGAQVWHAGTSAYYEANTAAILTDVPGVSSVWDVITELDPYVALEQEDETAIGLVRGVYDEDPTYVENPKRIPWRLGANGVHLLGQSVPTSVWVWFKLREPEFNGAVYSASSTYASGDRRYYSSASVGFEGDYWTAAATTTAGQNPETNPEKWARVEFPVFLRSYVVQAAYADWLRADGQTDKAVVEEQAAESLLGQSQLQALSNQPPQRWRVA